MNESYTVQCLICSTRSAKKSQEKTQKQKAVSRGENLSCFLLIAVKPKLVTLSNHDINQADRIYNIQTLFGILSRAWQVIM